MSKEDNIRIFLNTSPQLGILEHIVSLKLFSWYALNIEDLHHGSRESALWRIWCTFHKKYDGTPFDSLKYRSKISLYNERYVRVHIQCQASASLPDSAIVQKREQ